MRRWAIVVLLLLLIAPAAQAVNSEEAADVEGLLRRNLDLRTFDFGVVDPSFVGVVITGGQRFVKNRDQMIADIKKMAPLVSSAEMKNLTIISKTENLPFIVVTYSYIVTVKTGEKQIEMKSVDTDIWEKRGKSLKVIFSAHTDHQVNGL